VTRGARAALLPLVAFFLAGCEDRSRSENQPSVLDRAIVAAGGASNLAAIRSIETHSRSEHPGGKRYTTIQRLLPDRYRHDVDMYDAHHVEATDGTDIWATLDDYPIPVAPGEAESLRVSRQLGQISMLLPLKTIAGIKIKDEGHDDGFDVLRVTFPKDPKLPSSPNEPYRLSFDASTSLLRQIDFEAVIFGAASARQTRIELLDYRLVDGVMVPFASKMSVGDERMEEHIERVAINPSIPVERFQRPKPPTDLVIATRSIPEALVAMLEQHGARPGPVAEAEDDLARWVDKNGLARNGPPFRLQPLSEDDLPAVGVPVAALPPDTRPTTRPTTREQPRIAVLPACTALTTVIPGNDPAARSAAIERLLSRARGDGCEPAGPCKIVVWSPDILQLQLPIRPKKG
jgi:hypothetical protein